MKPSIYVETPNIDSCYIPPKGLPIGFTSRFEVRFSGELDHHGMICDFTQAKKVIKELAGFYDHAIWISSLHNENITRVPVNSNRGSYQRIQCENDTDSVTLDVPQTMRLITIPDVLTLAEAKNYVMVQLEEHISKTIQDEYNMHGFKIRVVPIDDLEYRENTHVFNYMHVLPFHEGKCANFHGHACRVTALDIVRHAKVMEMFSGKIVIDSNTKKEGNTYIIDSRLGELRITGNPEVFFEIDGESTSENIGVHLATELKQNINISEGWEKGTRVSTV